MTNPRRDGDKVEEHVRFLLSYVGEDATREGLVDTPARVRRALLELTAGYGEDPKDILSTSFDAGSYDEMVILRGIKFHSLCEHHMLVFSGEAAVGYLPGARVVGLSKLARLVECYARRLQIQERMTREIADALEVHIEPNGVGVIVRAHHSCMGCRGVRQAGSEMVTSAMLGSMKENPETRAEFLALAGE